jgi:hypothetical protein
MLAPIRPRNGVWYCSIRTVYHKDIRLAPTAAGGQTIKSDAVRVWGRLPGESSKAFRAFRLYWALGPKRSLAAVTSVLAREKNGGGRNYSGDGATKQRKNGKSGQVGLWSRKYAWDERAQEWDDQAARYYQKRRAQEYHSMCERHLEQIRAARAVIDPLLNEISRVLRERQHEFQAMNFCEQMKLVLRIVRVALILQKTERDAVGVQVVFPKSGSVPEWHFHRPRVQGGFHDGADLAFWTATREFGRTAEQVEDQLADEMGIKPWDRQRGESARAYAAFCLYRDLGPDRSLAEVTRRAAGTQTATIYVLKRGDERSCGRKRKSGQVGGWCRKFGWIERCQAWDLYQTAVYKNGLRTDIEQMAERHANQARLLLELQLTPIAAAAKSIGRRRYDLAQMSFSQIHRLLVRVGKVSAALNACERRARRVEPDNRKDQARGSRWRNEFFSRSASSSIDAEQACEIVIVSSTTRL